MTELRFWIKSRPHDHDHDVYGRSGRLCLSPEASCLMKCQELAERIQQLEPCADDADVARLCLLISNAVDSLENVDPNEDLLRLHREIGLKMQAATDQHAAMTAELEDLAKSDPAKFSKDQVWVLIRAIKVQSQILQLYLGDGEIDV